MEMVILKCGCEEPEPLVKVTMHSFSELWKTKPMIAYELVMLCRDKKHTLFGISGETLKNLALVQPDGSVHDSIRNIITSAVTGEELEMTITSPIK